MNTELIEKLREIAGVFERRAQKHARELDKTDDWDKMERLCGITDAYHAAVTYIKDELYKLEQ